MCECVCLFNCIVDVIDVDVENFVMFELFNIGKIIIESCWDMDGIVVIFCYFVGLVVIEFGFINEVLGIVISCMLCELVGVCGFIMLWNYLLL